MARRTRRSGRPAKPYDATTKYLFELDPTAWLASAGLRPRGPVRLLDTDLSTVQAQVDRVVWVDDPEPWLAHVEFQSSRDPDLLPRLLQYNALLHGRYRRLVETVLVLLRPSADGAELTETYRLERADGTMQLQFGYRVVRVWQQAVEAVLAGPLAGLPLAPLARVARSELPEVLRRVDERLRRETAPAESDRLWTATFWLSGLRYTQEVTRPLFEGLRAMRDSATYQAVLAEGRAEGRAEGLREIREIVLRLGQQRFGPPDSGTRRALAAIEDFGRLERLGDRLLQAASWDELLATS